MPIVVTITGLDEALNPRHVADRVESMFGSDEKTMAARATAVMVDKREPVNSTLHERDQLRAAFEAGQNYNGGIDGDPAFSEFYDALRSGGCQHPKQYRSVTVRRTFYDTVEDGRPTGIPPRVWRSIECERCGRELNTRYPYAEIEIKPLERG